MADCDRLSADLDTELTAQERERMRQLAEELRRRNLRDFWRSWTTWIALGGCVLTVAILITMALYLQRLDYQRNLDASEHRAVNAIGKRQDELMKAIAELKVKDAHSEADRRAIKKTVDQLKAEVQGQP
jgi:hypothetical protein